VGYHACVRIHNIVQPFALTYLVMILTLNNMPFIEPPTNTQAPILHRGSGCLRGERFGTPPIGRGSINLVGIIGSSSSEIVCHGAPGSPFSQAS
jgi:hypothetical protein